MIKTIRRIEKKDDKKIEAVIRTCLIEFGANHEGTAWADPDLDKFSQVYSGDKVAYWVVEDDQGNIVGGVGIGDLVGEPGTCELQKMYLLPEVRGAGIAQELMEIALDFAKDHYKACYIETKSNMTAAHRLYENSQVQNLM